MSGSDWRSITVFMFLLCGPALLPGPVSAGTKENAPTIAAEARADNDSVYIGEAITYAITAQTRSSVDVEFPLYEGNIAGLTISDFEDSEKNLFGRKTITHRYILSAYRPGGYTLPKAAIRYRIKDAEWRQIHTDEVSIEVKSVLQENPDERDIRGIKGPVGLKTGFLKHVIAIALSGLIVLLAVFAMLRAGKARRQNAPVMIRSAHEVALERLEALAAKRLAGQGKVKEHYTELSDIVRRYLEARFGLKVPEMTTEEFLGYVKNSEALLPEHKALLGDFLSHCDLVKFAKYGPSPGEIGSSFESAGKLVDQTRQAARQAAQQAAQQEAQEAREAREAREGRPG